MKKLVLPFALILLISSCGKKDVILKEPKSITEDYTLKELNTLSKDSLFSNSYDAISRFKTINLNNKLALSKYYNLTWEVYINFLKTINGSEFNAPYVDGGEFEIFYENYSTPFLNKGQKIMDSLIVEYKDGRLLYEHTSKLLWDTEGYLEYVNSKEPLGESMKNFYLGNVVRKTLEPTFKNQYEYYKFKKDSTRNLINPLANDLFNDLEEIYIEIFKEIKKKK
jgi:hypothetical protein